VPPEAERGAARLPPLPASRVVVARDRTAESRPDGGFLNVRRLDLKLEYPDGSTSAPFVYDVATREALDAVIMAATYVEDGVRYVYLRSAVRPPLALRAIPPEHGVMLWELPAGLVEAGEDPAETAVRELAEELGFAAEVSDLRPLGHWTFPTPGMIAERQVYYVVDVDPKRRTQPTEDGSVLERDASIIALPVEAVLEQCRTGGIRDLKTELGVRRLAELSGPGPERPRR
jgi:ADP-ribose pyrophosphatase